MKLNPYIQFRDDAAQALEFYREVFGGDLETDTFGEYGDPEAPEGGQIMHGLLQTPDGFTLMAADTPPGEEFTPGTAITISLSGEDPERLSGFFHALSEGGTIGVPLEKQMWGDTYGQLVDRFGVAWMVNIAGGQSTSSTAG